MPVRASPRCPRRRASPAPLAAGETKRRLTPWKTNDIVISPISPPFRINGLTASQTKSPVSFRFVLFRLASPALRRRPSSGPLLDSSGPLLGDEAVANKRRTVFPSRHGAFRDLLRPCRRAERRAAAGGRAWRGAAAGHRRRRGRQDGDARPSPRPSRAFRRRPQAHHVGDFLAPRRGRAQPPRPAHPRPPPRPRGRRGGDAELQRHLPFDRRAAAARIRAAHRPRSRLHHPRPRGFGRPDGALPPRGRPVAEGRALPDQGDLPGDLFARRQRANPARGGARPALSLGGGARSGVARPVRRPMSRPSSASACSITTTCCSISPRCSPSRRWRPRSRRASTICWSTNTRTPTACRPRSC